MNEICLMLCLNCFVLYKYLKLWNVLENDLNKGLVVVLLEKIYRNWCFEEYIFISRFVWFGILSNIIFLVWVFINKSIRMLVFWIDELEGLIKKK